METSTTNQLFSKDDLKKLIIPLLFEQALAITVGMADTVMISSAGEAAVSGVSLIDMFNNLIISVLAALATGGAVVTSQFLGAGKKEDACKSAKQLIVSSVCITIGISILVMVFCNGIISLFFGKIEADVFHDDLRIVLPVFGFVQFLCSAVPLHGKFQDHIEGLRGGKYHQHRGKRPWCLCAGTGRGRCGDPFPDLPWCGGFYPVSLIEKSVQRSASVKRKIPDRLAGDP